MEFLTTLTTTVPEGTTDEIVAETRAREALRAAELIKQGHLIRLWRPPLEPGEWRSILLWSADSESELEDLLGSLPLRPWMTVEITPLQPHPSDPVGNNA
jgi:muconolactone D-isomerase